MNQIDPGEDQLDEVPEQFDRLDPDESIERDIEWDDQLTHLTSPRESTDTDLSAVLENRSKSDSLIDHLCDQLRLTRCTEKESQIAEIVFELLDEDGFVMLSDDELLAEVQELVASHPHSGLFAARCLCSHIT
ncbi:MAG: hypothetical protein J4G19_05495 [Pseudomonadales bacterium]|nr:hypothetical protein [Pseudomonadales bacterium]